jgi:hypothetical protein
VIELCKEENVPILIHCSSTEVTMRPRMGPLPIAIGLTEYKAEPPYSPDDLPPYAASKLRAERLALAENMTFLQNGKIHHYCHELLIFPIWPQFTNFVSADLAYHIIII